MSPGHDGLSVCGQALRVGNFYSAKGLGLDEKVVARFVRGLDADAKRDVLTKGNPG